MKQEILFVFTLVCIFSGGVQGHGRLLEPASRGSLWRFHSGAPVNYNDNELFCGGFADQWQKYGGKCGVCGDSYGAGQNGRLPRPHEAGGHYGRGLIVRQYKQGEEIDVVVELTKNHRGHFEFKICPTNDPLKRATEQCLARFRLQLADGSGYKYPITTARNGFYDIKLKLPADLHCEHCVLQWRYRNGNNWGICPDGEGRLGCGDQEEFRGCADVSIQPSSRPKPGGKPYSGTILLKPAPTKTSNTLITACSPIVQNTSPERYKDTFRWCEDMCLKDRPHEVCSMLCHCE